LANLFIIFIEDRHLDAVVRVLADAAFNVVAVAIEHSGGNRRIFLEDLAQLELHAQLAVGELILGDQDNAAGVTIEAENDAWPVFAAGRTEMSKVKLQSIDESSGPVPLGGVNYHVGWLVDHRQELVFIQDVEGNVLRNG